MGEGVAFLPQVEELGTIPGPSGQDLLSSLAPVCTRDARPVTEKGTLASIPTKLLEFPILGRLYAKP